MQRCVSAAHCALMRRQLCGEICARNMWAQCVRLSRQYSGSLRPTVTASGGTILNGEATVAAMASRVRLRRPLNIMTAARGHRKPSRARANVKGDEIASVLPG